MTFTHIFSNATKEIRPLDDAPAAVREVAFRALGFKLLDIDRADFDANGNLCYRKGGWSYGHFQDGWICAGAGGLNSMRVIPA